jgi:RNA polymerase sigma-70 factor, ECF subfamily
MIDEQLFKTATGEEFKDYYTRYFPKLVYFLSSYSKDEKKAEDLAQETFIQCLEKLQDYNPETSRFSTWMYTVGKNLALQRIKKEEKLPSTSMDQDREGVRISDFLAYEVDHEEHYHYKVVQEKHRIMVEEIHRLPEKYRKVIVMREIDRMPYDNISKEVNLNLNTVKSQIKQGRSLLIKSVKKRYEMIEDCGIE